MPSVIVVMPGPVTPVGDLDTVATLMLLVLAAGLGWFLWRRK
jgi:LPXTG-motif cell wall-anchored protein